MTDTAEPSPAFVGITGALSAGRMLRDARQAQGLHIAALATSIKVAPRKLELLESDRTDELPDPAFARALAQTVCRALKIDPAPVLKLLPSVSDRRLESVGEGLNTPFRDRPGQFVPSDWGVLRSPAVWGPLIVVLAALGIWLLPPGLLDRASSGLGAAGGRAASSAAVSVGTTVATPALADIPLVAGSLPAATLDAAQAMPSAASASNSTALPPASVAVSTPGSLGASAIAAATAGVATPSPAAPAASAASLSPLRPAESTRLAASVGAGPLQLRTSSASWVEVTDARGRSLLARLLQPGETVGLDGTAPFKVRIGNASGTELSFRGQPMSLASHTRDNVARLDLK